MISGNVRKVILTDLSLRTDTVNMQLRYLPLLAILAIFFTLMAFVSTMSNAHIQDATMAPIEAAISTVKNDKAA